MSEKKPIDILLDKVDYQATNYIPKDEDAIYATHEGILKLGEISIKVCVLNTGQRIILADEIEKVFGNDWLKYISLDK